MENRTSKLVGWIAGVAIAGLAAGSASAQQLTLEGLAKTFPKPAEAPADPLEAEAPAEADVAVDEGDCSEEENDQVLPNGMCAQTLSTDRIAAGQLGYELDGEGPARAEGAVRYAKSPRKKMAAGRPGSRERKARAEAAARGDLHIGFQLGSANLTATDQAELRIFATFMKTMRPDARFRIEGHTDALGSLEFNDRLSTQRAEAVRSFLVQDGIAPGRLEVQGFGFARLRDPARPTSGVNRRVEAAELTNN